MSVDASSLWTLKPRMANYIRHVTPVDWIVRQHQLYQVLERGREESSRSISAMQCPEIAPPVLSNELVDLVLVASGAEWRHATSLHDEKDDAQGEQIDDLAFVLLAPNQLWGHVAGRSDTCLIHTIAFGAFKRANKSVVDDLQTVLVVK